MKLETVTPPAAEPVSYADVKAHLRLDDDTEQAWLTARIVAAREYAETSMQRSLVSRQLRATWYDSEDAPRPFVLPRGPVVSVDDVTDRDGFSLAPADFELRRIGTADVLHLKSGPWPLAVTYTAGYGQPADVPTGIKTGILMHVAHLWRSREAVSDRPQHHVALGLEALYGQHAAGGLL